MSKRRKISSGSGSPSYVCGPVINRGEDDEDVGIMSINLEDLMGGGRAPPVGAMKPKNRKIERDENHIYFYAEVNRDTCYDMVGLINEAADFVTSVKLKMRIDELPIYLHIMSHGGCVFSAFNIIDVIKKCKVPIYSIIEGCAASAATMISIVCDKRFIMPSAYMLIHQISGGCWGKMCEMQDEMENMKELTERLKLFYREHTEITNQKLSILLKRDLWLNAQKCIDYGLVDEIDE